MLSAHILHTKRYAAFCASFGDGTFIHHEPGAGGVEAYKATLQAYRSTFEARPACCDLDCCITLLLSS